MDAILFFSVLFVLYMFMFCVNHFFKSCWLYNAFDSCLQRLGITFQFLRVRWHTTALNRTINRSLGSSCGRSWLSKSFTLGVIVSFLLLPVGIILLFITIFGSSSSGNATDKAFVTEGLKVEILLPGINLPLEEVCYYLLALLFSSVVHEGGHALAAILEDVPVTGFGFQLNFCIPLAYTEISGDHLNSLKWFRKLRILCAGIWHNFIFAAFCYLLLSTVNFMASPFYILNKGVVVTEVTATSPLRAKEKGLYEGNIITHINDCSVINDASWYFCLMKALRVKNGYCVTSDFIRLNDESIEISHHGPDGTLRCCDDKNEKLCCFEYIDDLSNDTPIEIPQHVCLDVRRTLESSSGYCTGGRCSSEGFCLRALLRNTTTICTIKRTNLEYTSLRDVIYIGNPIRDIARTVEISGFVPKQNIISPQLADAYVLFLKYNVVFSFGLALINAVPCFGLDGYHIVSTIINSFLVNRVTERPKRDVIALIISGMGTLLFSAAVLKVLLLSVIRNFF